MAPVFYTTKLFSIYVRMYVTFASMKVYPLYHQLSFYPLFPSIMPSYLLFDVEAELTLYSALLYFISVWPSCNCVVRRSHY